MSTPPLIDTHCHLVLLEQRGLLEQALEGAAAAGVERIVTIGVSLDDSDSNRVIAEAHAPVYFAVGWDPQQPAAPDAAQVRALAELLRHPKAVAVGEVGLDYNFRPGYHETPVDVQRRSFRTMLELAVALDKPVVVHDRDAHDDVLQQVAEVQGARGVMHCFTGDAAHAARCLDAGFRISFSGIVTFPRADSIHEAARSVAGDAFVVETDAPFLTPVPHRGSVNLPARVADTARKLAELRGSDEQRVREQTTATARALFRFDAPATP